MKKVNLYTSICSLLFIMALLTSCDGRDKLRESTLKKQVDKPTAIPEKQPDTQIAEYIRNIIQDKNGNLWFGTNGYGVAHYDGDKVSYYSKEDGFDGHQITGMTEDAEKNIWFATDQGVVKYDWSSDKDGKKRFINYSVHHFLKEQHFWSVFADSKGNIWAGSAGEIYRFDGVMWTPFELPYPEEIAGKFITKGTTWSISEDSKGNMWFSTNGFGAFKYDGKSFTQYSKKDGLADDSIDHILEDSKGNMWFGTRHGGISKYDGTTYTNYTAQDSIGNDEVCVVYEDKKGNIWLSSEGYGVYRFNGQYFTNYSQDQGLDVRAVQTIFEDREGRFWVGGGGGLYRLDGESFINVTKNGPWK